MNRALIFLALATRLIDGQQFNRRDPKLAQMLNFEMDQKAGALPLAWTGTQDLTVVADDKVVHGGRWSARIERDAKSANPFSTLTYGFPVDFAGNQLTLRGFIRTEEVAEFAGLWIRVDGVSGTLAFDNMQSRGLKGTTDWKEYTIQLPLHTNAQQLYIGFLMAGTGKAWVDDMQLLLDGKPVWDAPVVERPKTILDEDNEFDKGSGIAIDRLTPLQIDNLARLGKIWGFLKYHHPAITGGKRHWDYDLFRVMPAVLKAPDRAAGNAAIVQWVNRLGPVEPCKKCATLKSTDIRIRPDVEWVRNESYLGPELSKLLRTVYENRTTGTQFYVSKTLGVGNPVFENEPSYQGMNDAGFRVLGLYRFWNVIAYWFPYRDVTGEDWDQVMAEFIPRIALAATRDLYQLEMIPLIGRAHDTHANLWSGLRIRPPVGECGIPIVVRFVGDVPAVVVENETEFRKGDILESIDRRPVPVLISEWTAYYADSNEAARQRDMAAMMTRGVCGETTIQVRRDGESVEVKAQRVSNGMRVGKHDLPGEAFRMLSPEVAYLKLSAAKAGDAVSYVQKAAAAKGMIIDIRNYPSEFVVFALGELLVEQPTKFVRFTTGDLDNPGAFAWGGEGIVLSPKKPHFAGKVVILVDETSQSQAEYTAMALRSGPNAVIVGSTTAGADGNVSQFALPGGLSTMISGLGVFYPDGRPTQRVGILPDFVVRPTLAGVRAGRDEVLEAGIRLIAGEAVAHETIRAMIQPVR